MRSSSEDEPSQPPSGTPYRYVPRLTDDEVFSAAKRWRLLGWISVAVVLILIGLYFVQRFRTAVRAPSVDVPTSLASPWTTGPGLSISPAFSHDGRLVAYASDREGPVFSASRGTNLHLWELVLDPHGWQASGTPRQLTNSDGIDQTGATSPDGRLLFGTMQVTIDIWTLSLDGDRGKPAAAPQRITDDHALNQTPAVGLNTANMVYVSNKTGTGDIWVHDLKTGVEWALTAYNRVNYRPVLSPDENRVAYGTSIDKHCAIVLQDLDRGSRRDIVSGCFNIWDWSPDGSSLLIFDPAEAVVSAQLLKLESGQRLPLISRPNFSVFDASFSRDGKWVAFSAGSTLNEAEVFIAPFHGAAIKQADWIPVTRGRGSLSAWSADGDTLFYHSDRDGFHCIWAQGLNSAKQPAGEPYAIQHLHSVSFGMYIMRPNDFHMSATKDHLVFNLTTETANLWLTAKP
jgi:eukaryotic-like serine/threonine-protein kinase